MEPIEHLHIGYGRHESSDLSHHAQQFFSEKKNLQMNQKVTILLISTLSRLVLEESF